MTAEDDSQRQVTMCSSSMPETATMDKKVQLEDDTNFMKQTRPSRKTPVELKRIQKMTTQKMTAPPSKYQTEADGSTTVTRRAKILQR